MSEIYYFLFNLKKNSHTRRLLIPQLSALIGPLLELFF